ncbi:MAG: GtrA family protein [Eubacterium sp.]
MDQIKQLFAKYKEIVMYLIMGVATTVVNWVLYALSVSLINTDKTVYGFDVDVLISNIIAWTLAVIFAYVTNKIFVFESYSWNFAFVLKEFALFVSARLVTGVLEILGVPFLVGLGLNQTILGFEGMLSKILVSVIVVILNYVFSKLIIFKKNDLEK